jgi:hypothetical protein
MRAPCAFAMRLGRPQPGMLSTWMSDMPRVSVRCRPGGRPADGGALATRGGAPACGCGCGSGAGYAAWGVLGIIGPTSIRVCICPGAHGIDWYDVASPSKHL